MFQSFPVKRAERQRASDGLSRLPLAELQKQMQEAQKQLQKQLPIKEVQKTVAQQQKQLEKQRPVKEMRKALAKQQKQFRQQQKQLQKQQKQIMKRLPLPRRREPTLLERVADAGVFVVVASVAFVLGYLVGRAGTVKGHVARLRDQFGATARDVQEAAQQRAEWTSDVAQGKVHEVRTMAEQAAGQDSQELADEQTITDRVKSSIGQDRWLGRLPRLNINTVDGVVYLRGFVRTEAQKRRAESIARSAEGVTDVVNELNVEPEEVYNGEPHEA